MKANSKPFCLIFLLALISFSRLEVLAGSYPSPIEYKGTLARILQEADVADWSPECSRHFNHIAVNTGGSRIGFTADLFGCLGQHLYVMNEDGTGLTDITAGLPTEVDTVEDLLINDAGSRLFFHGSPGHTTDYDVYNCNTASGTCSPAVTGIHLAGIRRRYSVNSAGDRLFFRGSFYHSGSAEWQNGLYYADVGGAPVWVMDVDVLPWVSGSWYNNLSFLGSSGDGTKLLFTWDTNSTAALGEAMWYVGIDGTPHRSPDEEHDSVWDVACSEWHINNMVSMNGGTALHVHQDSGNPEKLYAVDLSTGAKTFIGETKPLNGVVNVGLSQAGEYALFSGDSISHTLVNLETGAKRDTLSHHIIGWSGCLNLTDLTSDGSCYFWAVTPKVGGEWQYSRIYRVDMAPADFTAVPNVTSIAFSAPALLHDETTTITLYATVSDAQGLGTIEWVKMHTLVEGQEFRDWTLVNPAWSNAEPLLHDVLLYDDGTHGDHVAGDGVYTNDSSKTNGTSGFYNYFTLPHDCGIRIVAKDEDDNYVIADTLLTITDDMSPYRKMVIPWFLLFDE